MHSRDAARMLLRADLQALANLALRRDGRRLAFGSIVALSVLALLSWFLGQAVLGSPMVLELLAPGESEPLRGLLGYALMPATVVAGWLGLALAQRQLFDAPELPLWQSAPLRPWRAPSQGLIRATFLALLWSAALALPLVCLLLASAQAHALAWALLPLAILAALLPLLTSVLTVQIVLVRFFAGRVLQIVLTIVAALASFLFTAFLLTSVLTSEQAQAQRLIEQASRPELPWMVATGGRLLAAATRGTLDLGALLQIGGWVLGSLLLFLLTCRLHPAAVERHQRAGRPTFGSLRAFGWPSRPTASIRRKEFAQLLQQPGSLLGLLVFALLVFVLAREQVLIRGILAQNVLATPVRHLLAMAALWFLAVLMVLYAHMGRLVLWDGPQWGLYLSAPARPAALLAGKLQAIWLLLGWPLLVVLGIGRQLLGADWPALLTFAAIGLAGNTVALGVVAVIGTAPLLMRPDAGGQLAQGHRSLGAALLLVLAFELAVSPAFVAWVWFAQQQSRSSLRRLELATLAPWAIGGAWALAVVVGGLGCWLGTRNYRRLLTAR